MVYSTLSVHSEATQHQQPQRTVLQSTSKNVATNESRMFLFDKIFLYLSSMNINLLEPSLFAFTSWTYRPPPTPPTVRRPYLYRPDYRPAGAYGHKRM